MRIKDVIAGLLSAAILVLPQFADAQEAPRANAITIVTDYSYKPGAGDSQEKREALALFGARYKAVLLAAKYLAHRGLLPAYGKKEKEIYCLAAGGLSVDILEKKRIEDTQAYYVKIKAKVDSVDFIKAEIKDLELEKAEMHFSWQEKLEQYVYKSIEPAAELSRAYRYLRKGYFRISVIYLDHLERKYPNWAELYHVKAIGLYVENKLEAMMEALKVSCSLGNREACEDIDGLAQHAKDFKIF